MRKCYAITITGVLLLFQQTWTQNVGVFGRHVVACSRLVSNWDLFRKTCKSTPFFTQQDVGFLRVSCFGWAVELFDISVEWQQVTDSQRALQ